MTVDLEKRRIVIIGSKGQLGSYLCRILPHSIGLDLPSFDITNKPQVMDILCRLSPEIVINTAAYTKVDYAENEPGVCRAVNAYGAAYLAEACRKLNALLVHISTDYVFGADQARKTPYREDDTPGPVNTYGRTKLMGEQYVKEWERHLLIRTCGLYGKPGANSPPNFPMTILRRARQGGRLAVVNDQYCSPTFVPHLAEAILFLLREEYTGLFHIVNRGEITWYEFAVHLLSESGLKTSVDPISSEQYGGLAARPRYSVLDTSKYHSLPGCFVMPSWQEALQEFIALQKRGEITL